jgi:acetyltransferase
MSIKNLDVFFNPHRIAVIGASDDKRSLGYYAFRNLVGKGFKGVVFPVDAHREAVQGVEAYKTIVAIPHQIDLAIVASPAAELYTALDECGQKDVKGVIILAPHFEYPGVHAEELESQIRRISNIYGFRVMGPNSFGFLRPSKNLNASLFPHLPRKGNIAFICQSGIFSSAFLERAISKQMGFSHFISLGGKLDIDLADLIDYLGIDPETRAIILYVEIINNGRKFMTAVRSFSSSKPIVVVRSGRAEVSGRMFLTHSGALAGEDKVYEAAFRRAGAVRVYEMLDLFYMTETLAKQHRPRGKRLAIINNSLGPTSMAVDALILMEGELAALGKEVLDEIGKNLTLRRKVNNPVCLLPDASPADFELAVRSCLKDEAVDGILVVYVPFPCFDPRDIAAAVVKAAKSYPEIPLFTTWLGDEQVLRAREFLSSNEVPTFVTPEQAVKSFLYMYRYDFNLKLLHETPESILKDFVPYVEKVGEVIRNTAEDGRAILRLDEAKKIFEVYGIPMVETVRAVHEDDAVRLSEKIGYPVVLKIDSEKIFHKLEKGGVVLNLRDEKAVREAYRSLKIIASQTGDTEAGVVIQPMVVKKGYELVIGAKKDPSFGSVIVFGTGGELLDAIKDYSIGLPPLNQALARRMMEETKIYQYLQSLPSYQGILRLLEEILVRFSQLIVDFHHIREIEINPFLLSDKYCIALDGGILLEEDALTNQRRATGDLCPPHLSICPYPFKYVVEKTLSDGTVCYVRPIRGEDEPLIYEFFKTLSDETIIYRFCHHLTYIPHEKLVRYCQVDYDRELAFVALSGDGRDIIGDVRISKLPDLENAEVSILVADALQGKGVGSMLMDYCIDIAKEAGLTTLWMEILKNNSRMLALSRKYNFKQAYDDEDMVRVVLKL